MIQILLGLLSQGIIGEENNGGDELLNLANYTTTPIPSSSPPNDNIEIDCASTEIKVRIKSPHPDFNGMIYPQVNHILIKPF